MSSYADSSFLVSCYLNDANTPRSKSYLQQNPGPLPFTALHSLEIRNAFRLGVFRGLFSAADAAAALVNLEQDLRSGRLVRSSTNWPLSFRLASLLSKQHTTTAGTRSLDILHVAVARSLRATSLISFDSRQRTLATFLGIKVEP